MSTSTRPTEIDQGRDDPTAATSSRHIGYENRPRDSITPSNQQQDISDDEGGERNLSPGTTPLSPTSASTRQNQREPKRKHGAGNDKGSNLYPLGAALATWPHSLHTLGTPREKQRLLTTLDANLYDEVAEIARRTLLQRQNDRKHQTEMPTSSANISMSLQEQVEVSPSVPRPSSPRIDLQSSLASSSSLSPSSPPSPAHSQVSSRTASSIAFSEEQEDAAQPIGFNDTDDEDDPFDVGDEIDSLSSCSSISPTSQQQEILPLSLIRPIHLEVLARLDSLLYSLSMKYLDNGKGSTIERKRKRKVFGYEEVLQTLERIATASGGERRNLVEMEMKRKVVARTKQRVLTALKPGEGGEGAATNTMLPSSSHTQASSRDDAFAPIVHPKPFAGRLDDTILLEPFGIHRRRSRIRIREQKRQRREMTAPMEDPPSREDREQISVPDLVNPTSGTGSDGEASGRDKQLVDPETVSVSSGGRFHLLPPPIVKSR